MFTTFLRRARVVATVAAAMWAFDVSAASADYRYTFTKDVAPILFAHCASCHNAAGSAPFSVLMFEEVRPRAKAIASAVQRRSMPPWKPEPGHGDFVGTRRLSDEQIDVIVRWADAGAPLGDPAAMPSRPSLRDRMALGQPDLVVRMPAPYRLAPGGPDRLRNFVMPIPLTRRRYVRAWAFQINNQRVVHHATVMLDPTRASRELDEQDPDPGYEGLIALSARNPDGYFLGWTPGQSPSMATEHMAWPLDPDTDLVLMLHLRPTDAWQTVDVGLEVYFTDVPPARTPTMIRLNRQDLDIPAGDPHYVVTDSYVLPVDVDAVSVQPHAHSVATAVRAWATLPNGTNQWLIDIRHWDFDWQDVYRYSAPISLPAGSRLSMEFTFDNSDANRANPNRPPQPVTWGQRTIDEMADVWLQVVPRDPAASAVLNRSVQAKLLPQNIAGYRSLLRTDPDNAALHDDLAILFSQARDDRNTVAQFGESLRLRPNAASHYNLGNALARAGDWATAKEQFTAAVDLNPSYALAHQGLALALVREGQRIAAIEHLREAARVSPTLEESHYNLGVLLAAERQRREAEAAFVRAAELARQALTTAEATGDQAGADAIRRRLAVYLDQIRHVQQP